MLKPNFDKHYAQDSSYKRKKIIKRNKLENAKAELEKEITQVLEPRMVEKVKFKTGAVSASNGTPGAHMARQKRRRDLKKYDKLSFDKNFLNER